MQSYHFEIITINIVVHIYPEFFKYSILENSTLWCSMEVWLDSGNLSLHLKHLEMPEQMYQKITAQVREGLSYYITKSCNTRKKEEQRWRLTWDLRIHLKSFRPTSKIVEIKCGISTNGRSWRRWIQQNSGTGRRNKEKSPKWNAQNNMAERSPNRSVIIIIQRDYIQVEAIKLVFKNPYLLLPRDVFKIIRLRKAGNKEMEKAFDISGKCWRMLALHTEEIWTQSHTSCSTVCSRENMEITQISVKNGMGK